MYIILFNNIVNFNTILEVINNMKASQSYKMLPHSDMKDRSSL